MREGQCPWPKSWNTEEERSPSKNLAASGTKRNEKEGKERRAKKKKAGRKDDHALADKKEGKKKKIRSFARRRPTQGAM